MTPQDLIKEYLKEECDTTLTWHTDSTINPPVHWAWLRGPGEAFIQIGGADYTLFPIVRSSSSSVLLGTKQGKYTIIHLEDPEFFTKLTQHITKHRESTGLIIR